MGTEETGQSAPPASRCYAVVRELDRNLRAMDLNSVRGLIFNVLREQGITPRKIAQEIGLTAERVQRLRRSSAAQHDPKEMAEVLRMAVDFIDPPSA